MLLALRCLSRVATAHDALVNAKAALFRYVQHALINVKNLSGIVRHEFQLHEREFIGLLDAEATAASALLADARGDAGAMAVAGSAASPAHGSASATVAAHAIAAASAGSGPSSPAFGLSLKTPKPTAQLADSKSVLATAARALLFDAIVPTVTDIAGGSSRERASMMCRTLADVCRRRPCLLACGQRKRRLHSLATPPCYWKT